MSVCDKDFLKNQVDGPVEKQNWKPMANCRRPAFRFLTFFWLFLFFSHCSFSTKDESNSPSNLYFRFFLRQILSPSLSPNSAGLPNSLSVAVPRSIRKNTASTSLSSRAVPGGPQELLSEGSSGLGVLQESTNIIGSILQESRRDLSVIASVYARAQREPETCIPGGVSFVTITQTEIDGIVDSLEKLGLTEAEAKARLADLQRSGSMPRVGQSIPSPAILYRRLSGGEYLHEVNYQFSETISTPQACPSNPIRQGAFPKTIRWNADRSQIFSTITKKLLFFNIDVDVNASLTYFTGDNRKDRTILQIDQKSSFGRNQKSQSSQRLTVEECVKDSDENTSNCVSLTYNSTESDGKGGKVQTTITGKTDNSGGLVKTELVFTGGPGNPPRFQVEETYDGTGNITWIRTRSRVGPGGWTPWAKIGDPGELDDAYGFDENSLFEDQVKLTLSSSTGSNSIGNDEGFEDYDRFVLVVGSANPGDDPDTILGFGVFLSSDISDSGSDTFEVEFFGEIDQIPNLRVWRSSFDPDTGEPSFTLMTNTVNRI